MGYIWSYIKKYPKWLFLDLLGALLFVVVNLGMPTMLARMIDQGVTKGDAKAIYFWAGMMAIIVVLGIIGRVTLSYASGRLTSTMIRDMRMTCTPSCSSIRTMSTKKSVCRHL